MSVILDALHKARGDKRHPQADLGKNSPARVIDAGVASDLILDAQDGGSGTRQRGRGGWVIALSLVFGVVFLCVVAGGAFFLLYSQGKRLEESRVLDKGSLASDGAAATLHPPVTASTDPTAAMEATKILETGLPLPSILPTPLPLSELPVQPPAKMASSGLTVDVAPPTAGVAGASSQLAGIASSATPAHTFKLGSIVCENNDCLASLNGRTVRVGDEIKQYQVLRITSKEVTLKSVTGNDVVTLSLFD